MHTFMIILGIAVAVAVKTSDQTFLSGKLDTAGIDVNKVAYNGYFKADLEKEAAHGVDLVKDVVKRSMTGRGKSCSKTRCCAYYCARCCKGYYCKYASGSCIRRS